MRAITAHATADRLFMTMKAAASVAQRPVRKAHTQAQRAVATVQPMVASICKRRQQCHATAEHAVRLWVITVSKRSLTAISSLCLSRQVLFMSIVPQWVLVRRNSLFRLIKRQQPLTLKATKRSHILRQWLKLRIARQARQCSLTVRACSQAIAARQATHPPRLTAARLHMAAKQSLAPQAHQSSLMALACRQALASVHQQATQAALATHQLARMAAHQPQQTAQQGRQRNLTAHVCKAAASHHMQAAQQQSTLVTRQRRHRHMAVTHQTAATQPIATSQSGSSLFAEI